jgi:hypothetical protein
VTPDHATVLAAIDKAREVLEPDVVAHRYPRAQHLDDLRATAERHAPEQGMCYRCNGYANRTTWPCPDYQQVVDRLTSWGVL